MVNRLTLVSLLITSTMLGACASQKPERPPREANPEARAERMEKAYQQFVDRWDYNRDGKATCDDIATQRSRLFKMLDGDDGGQLSSKEYRHAKFEDKSFMFFDFMRVDINTSGTIELEEFADIPHSQFLNIDKDQDCFISPPEVMAMMRDTMMPQGGDRKPGERGRGGRGRGGPMLTGE